MINKVIYDKKSGNFRSVGYMSTEAKEVLQQLNGKKKNKKKKKILKLNIFF